MIEKDNIKRIIGENQVFVEGGRYIKRDIDSLLKLSARYEIDRMIVITHDERETIETGNGMIEVLPAWLWLLES